eukprot:scaffold49518_cov36-Phaeocystis_antarctica.AAC.1
MHLHGVSGCSSCSLGCILPSPAPSLSRAIYNPQVVRGQPWTSRRSMRRLTRCVLVAAPLGRRTALPPQRAPLVARTA